jgi:predicted HTH transcriptional regulator
MIRRPSDLDALIAEGESDHVELKSSLHHPHGLLPADLQYRLDQGKLTETQVRKEVQTRLNKEVTKTVAAFLNTRGGTLLIGVDDSGAVVGIEHDFKDFKKEKDQNADGWLRSLKEVISNTLGPEVCSAIHVSLVPHAQGTVAVVECPARGSETWHREADGSEGFYVRASNATESLNGSGMVKYIREHWPA